MSFSEHNGLVRDRDQILEESVEALGNIQSMKIKMEMTQNQIADAERENSLLQKINSEIKDDIAVLSDINLRLKNELIELCSNEKELGIKNVVEERKNLQNKLTNSENTRKKLELECQKHIKEMQNKVQILAQELKEKERKIIEIEGLRQEEYLCLNYEASSLEVKNEKGKSGYEQEKLSSEKAAKYEAEKQRLIQSYQKIHVELHETAKRIESFLRSLNLTTEKRLQKTIEDLREEVSKTVQLKKLFEDTREQLQNDLLILQEEQVTKLQALQEKISALHIIKKELLREIGVVNAEKEALSTLHNQTKDKNEMLQTQLNSVENENASMKTEIQSFKEEVKVRDALIGSLKQEVDKLTACNIDLTGSLTKNTVMLEALNISCYDLAAEKSLLEKKVAMLQERLTSDELESHSIEAEGRASGQSCRDARERTSSKNDVKHLQEPDVQVVPVNSDSLTCIEEPMEAREANDGENFLIENVLSPAKSSHQVLELQRELELVREKQESLEKAIVDLEHGKSILVVENQKLKEKLKNKTEEVYHWQLEHDDFRIEYLELQKQLQAVLNEKVSLEKNQKAKLLALQKTFQEKDATIAKLRKKLQQATKNKDVFQTRNLEKAEKTQKIAVSEETKIMERPARELDKLNSEEFKRESSEETVSEINELNYTAISQQTNNSLAAALDILTRKHIEKTIGNEEEAQTVNNGSQHQESKSNEKEERDHWKWIAKKKTLKVELLKLNCEQTIQELHSILDFLSN